MQIYRFLDVCLPAFFSLMKNICLQLFVRLCCNTKNSISVLHNPTMLTIQYESKTKIYSLPLLICFVASVHQIFPRFNRIHSSNLSSFQILESFYNAIHFYPKHGPIHFYITVSQAWTLPKSRNLLCLCLGHLDIWKTFLLPSVGGIWVGLF